MLRTPADDHTAGGAWRLRRRRRCLDEAADDATKAVVWDERLALQLGTSARRGVVGAEPLSDGTSCAPKGVVGDACARLCGHTELNLIERRCAGADRQLDIHENTRVSSGSGCMSVRMVSPTTETPVPGYMRGEISATCPHV